MSPQPGDTIVAVEVLSGAGDGSVLAVPVGPSQNVRLSDAPALEAVAATADLGPAGNAAIFTPTGANTLRLVASHGATPLIDEQPARPNTELAVGQILQLGATELFLQQVAGTIQAPVGGITCPKCGTLNPTSLRWCRNCGFELLPPGAD